MKKFADYIVMKRALLIILQLIICFSLFSQTEGESFFRTNEPSLAVSALENEIKNGNVTENTYNYLALSYFQLGNYAKSIETFELGMKQPGANRKILYFNEGTVAYASEDYVKAENCFSLALTASPDFYNALLNRANTRLVLKKYNECIADYENYIYNVPDDQQRPKIEKLLSYLREEIRRQEEEAVRLAEEQKRLEEENQRIQEEIARQEQERLAKEAEQRAIDAERRRKLLEEVANSLQQTDTMNMTAGAADVMEYDYESELD